MKPCLSIFALFFCLLVSRTAWTATDIAPSKEDLPEQQSFYSPYVERARSGSNFSEGVFWGDTHLHTSYSTDAGMIGTTLDPADAYRFARGEEITTSTGQPARLIRALDFLVVSDHAENLGLAPMIKEANPDLLNTEYGRRLYDMVKAGNGYDAFGLWGTEGVAKNRDIINLPKMQRTVWDRQIEAADHFNDPGRFTALIGFEWTSINNMERPSNLHRVVIFKEDARKAGQILPFSTFDSEDPEKLWEFMQAYEDKTGGSVLAIPHNGNLSNGLMFAIERLNGRKLNKEYAETRMRWEPLYEVTQIKGDGEAHPKLSPSDEFADYGTWDKGDIAGFNQKTEEMLPYEYARSALQIGLQQQLKLGVNPFKFGMIGSTDAHTGLAGTREENFWGKMISSEPAADRMDHYVIRAMGEDESLSTYSWEEVSSGLAAVWARENTRAALFEAMQKKETYATTGTRIVVRFFGGWDYQPEDVYRPEAATIGYDKGVPMGGDLPTRSSDNAPIFMVGAIKDIWSGNLDRIQIVKGWVDKEGNRQERVYDVACADRAVVDHKCTGPIGSTVDEVNATYLNNIGDAELRTSWTDPDFDPDLPAVYYARVLEIPTPTWQAIDAKHYGVSVRQEIPLQHQERAYTSPIWYTP